MPSFLAHMMVLIDAANKLEGADQLAAQQFLFPNVSGHPVVTDLDVGRNVSQLAMLGANGPDIPGYRSFDVDADTFVLAILGGAAIAFGSIYATMLQYGERDEDSSDTKKAVLIPTFSYGAVLLLLPLLCETETTSSRWWGAFISLTAVPMLASGASLLFVYSKDDTKKVRDKQSLWGGIALLAVGAGWLLGGVVSIFDGAEASDYNMIVSYLVGIVIGLILAFAMAFFFLYRGADTLSSIFKGSSMLICGIFLAVAFPALFSTVPNFAKDLPNRPRKEHWFDMLHKHRSGDFAIALIQQAKDKRASNPEEGNRLMAFALGYISHLAADTIVHPYVNMFDGGGEDNEIDKWYSGFHRTVEVTQDSWLAKEFFQRDDVFTGESWTKYIDGTEAYKSDLDAYYRSAYAAVYEDTPPSGFIEDSHGVLIDLVADAAFDNEMYSARMPLMWLGGLFPFLFGGFLPSILWSFPWSPYMRIARASDLDDAAVKDAISKSIVPQQLGDRIGMLPVAQRDEIWAALGEQSAEDVREERVTTVSQAMTLIDRLPPDKRVAILDALDMDKIRGGAILSTITSAVMSAWDYISEIWSPEHWADQHIALEVVGWQVKAWSFVGLLFDDPSNFKLFTPIYYLSSALQGAFSLDKTLYSNLTKMSVVPPQNPDERRVHHTALPDANRTTFFRDTLLAKASERTRELWAEAVKFYEGTIDAGVFRDTIQNWNIDTGYLIEAKRAVSGADGGITIDYVHSWKKLRII